MAQPLLSKVYLESRLASISHLKTKNFGIQRFSVFWSEISPGLEGVLALKIAEFGTLERRDDFSPHRKLFLDKNLRREFKLVPEN